MLHNRRYKCSGTTIANLFTISILVLEFSVSSNASAIDSITLSQKLIDGSNFFEPTRSRSRRDANVNDLSKEFWFIYDKDMPHKFDKRHFDSPSLTSCANSAYQDGEKMAIFRAGKCWYKSVSGQGRASAMNRDGLLLGKYDVPLSDIDSPVDIETAKNWARSKKCDMIMANEGYEEFWCKRYVDSPGAVMLFRFEDMQNEPPITASRSGGGSYLSKFWPLTNKDMPHKLDKHHFESSSVSNCARSAIKDGEKLVVWRAGRCYYKEIHGHKRLLNRHGQQVGSFDVPHSDIDSPADNLVAEEWMRSGKCDMMITNQEQNEYWCKKYVDSPGAVMLFLRNDSNNDS